MMTLFLIVFAAIILLTFITYAQHREIRELTNVMVHLYKKVSPKEYEHAKAWYEANHKEDES